MQIEPQYTFPLVYQISDPTDTGTYYVQSVIRNSLTGSLITTVNLTDGGNGRFYGSTLSPKDPTGLGFHIDVTTTVYTDSGYSAVSEKYQKESRNYLVKKLGQFGFGGAGGGSGVDIDYQRIREIIQKEITPIVEAIVRETTKSTEEMKKCMDNMEMPEPPEPAEPPEPVDLSPVLEKIDLIRDELSKKIDTKEIELPEPPEPIDLTPIFERLDEISSKIDKSEEITTAQKEEFKNLISEYTDSLTKNNEEKTKKIFEALSQFLKTMNGDFIAPNVDNKPKEADLKGFFTKKH